MRERRRHDTGQAVVQVGGHDARPIRRRDEEVCVSPPSRKEVANRLHGCEIVPPAKFVGQRLILPLERDTSEHALAEILRRDLHQERRICHTRIARIVAHAIRHEMACFRRRRDDMAARAHAERIRPAPRLMVLERQRIVGDRQTRVACVFAILRAVDEFLRMLDAHADGECLRLHREALFIEHRIRVTRRVADAEERRVRRDALLTIHDECRKLSTRELHIRDLCPKAHLAAEADDLLADIFHDCPQEIRADMRLVQVADLLRRTRRDERFEHVADMRVIRARRELAVRKRAGTALTELYIRLRRERAALPEAEGIGMARIDILPALQNKRALPRPCKRQCRKHPGRAEAHDDRTMLAIRKRPFRHGRSRLFLLQCDILVTPQPREHALFRFRIAQDDIEHIDERNRRAAIPPRIDGLADDRDICDVLHRRLESLCRQFFERRSIVKRHGKIRDTEQALPSLPSSLSLSIEKEAVAYDECNSLRKSLPLSARPWNGG